MGFLKKDQDYIDLGVEPPKHIQHGLPLDVNTVSPEDHIHSWVQVGNFIECDRGNHVHGHPFDHMNKILIGTNPQGEPIYKDIELQ